MIWFNKDEILYLHSIIVRKTGGQDGIRDETMLESALGTPLQTFDSIDLYPTVIDKFARLAFGLVMNHPFIDGNKRTGAFALFTGFNLNRIRYHFDDEDAIREFTSLAAGEIGYSSFISWVRSKVI